MSKGTMTIVKSRVRNPAVQTERRGIKLGVVACPYTPPIVEVETGGCHGLLGQQCNQISTLQIQREIFLKYKVEN